MEKGVKEGGSFKESRRTNKGSKNWIERNCLMRDMIERGQPKEGRRRRTSRRSKEKSPRHLLEPIKTYDGEWHTHTQYGDRKENRTGTA